MGTRHAVDGIKWCAELLGLRYLYAGLNECTVAAAYLRRLGWKKFDYGYYTEV